MDKAPLPQGRHVYLGFIPAYSFILSLIFVLSTLSVRTDDAHIYLVYARNIAEGNGFVFNPGERVNGATSALFPMLIAFIGWPLRVLSTEPYLLASRLLQLLALTAIGVVAARFLARTGATWGISIFMPLFLSSTLTISGIGMESFVVLALLLLTLDLYLARKFTATSAAAGSLLLARPDSALFLLCLGLHYWWSYRRLPDIRYAIVLSSIVLPWVVFAYLYFGSIFPETLAAKTAQTQSGRWGHGLIYLRGFELVSDSYAGSTNILALFSLVALWLARSRLSFVGLAIFLSWGVLHFIAYAFLINPPAYPWYYTPFALPLALLISAALGGLIVALPARQRIFAAGIAFGLCGMLFVKTTAAHREQDETAKHQLYKLAAEWLNSHAPQKASVACNEVGIIGYYYKQGKIIDPLGLITKGAAEYVANKQYAWYVFELRPDFIVMNHPARAFLEEFHQHQWFKEKYESAVVLGTGRSRVKIYRRKVSERE